MFKRLSITFSDIGKIFSKDYLTISGKLRLLYAYCSIAVSRFFDGRFIHIKKKKFLFFTVVFESYSDFYWTFKEVFINDDYYFESKKENPVILDCGGNIGITTLYFKYLYPKSEITVFEPIPENIVFLKKNIKDIKGVTLIEKGVGSKEEELKMYGSNRAATLRQEFNEEQVGEINKITTVKIDSLSKYVEGEIDLLKLDIEGVEGEVLKEISENNKINKVVNIALEYHHLSADRNRLSSILNILEDNMFKSVVSGDFKNLGNMPKRDFYKLMVYATKNDQ